MPPFVVSTQSSFAMLVQPSSKFVVVKAKPDLPLVFVATVVLTGGGVF